MKKIILVIFSLFLFHSYVSAKSVACTYGSEGGISVIVGINESGSITKMKNDENPLVYNFVISANAFIDDNNNYYCPEKIVYKMQYDAESRRQYYVFSFVSDTNYPTTLDKTNENIDNTPLENEKVIDYTCKYGDKGQYVINYYTDGTVGTPVSDYVLYSDIPSTGGCLDSVYICHNVIYKNKPTYDSACSIPIKKYEKAVVDTDPITPPVDDTVDISELKICERPGILKAFQIVGYALFIMKILVPLILIGMGIYDFAKATISSDDKANSVAISSLVRRCIIAVVIFIMPTILNYVLVMIDGAVEKVGKDSEFSNCTTCLLDPLNCKNAGLEQNNPVLPG